jgi:ABC-2 type transport system ATP-binding protein
VITLKNVTQSFEGKILFNNLNLNVPKGKLIGVVGPDGSGKTTLIRLIGALLIPTSGTITVNGFDTVNEQEKIDELIGYMPQKFGLYEELTVEQNLNLYADLRNLKNNREETFAHLLKFTGLTPFTTRVAGALSGGMKQKLGLACSLISQPQLLLLDEPSVGVDPISRRELWKMVQELVENGVTTLWSTSYLDEAEKCDEVFLLDEGKVLFSGPPKELTSRVEGRVFLASPKTQEKRAFLTKALEENNVVDGVIQGSQVRLVFKEKKNPLKLQSTPPRFEDAFVDLLESGSFKKKSPLIDLTPPIHEKKGFALEASHLTKKFGSFVAADNISFQIKRGEIFGLLGPNGAGKTTTFKMLCGLLKPTQGESFVNGINLRHGSSEARAHIGYMAQKFSLYGTLSTKQNLEFFSGVYNLKGERKLKQIEQMIGIFSLEPYLNVSADLLPLGFKQRLALSCALMHSPDLLFLDEPTSGVDPITRREFWQHINALVEKGVTVIVTTHFMDEAEYCDRIGLIYKSQLIQMGTPDELKARAQTAKNPYPTLEEAFITSIEEHDKGFS